MMRLQAIDVSKSFGATRALCNVRLTLEAGEIHALLGENGAGKSTLLEIVGGVLRPGRGLLFLDGQPYAPASPREARHRGVSLLGQTAALADGLTVEENLSLGVEPSWHGWIDRRLRRALARTALGAIGAGDIAPDAPVARLAAADRQRVEIARVLLDNPRVLLLDEPARALSHWETGPLFEAIRRMAARGVAVVYISHFLEEAQALCTRYTVLREGEVAGAGNMAETSRPRLLRLMAGCDVRAGFTPSRRVRGRPLLRLERVAGRRHAGGINLTLHAGEILGLAGLAGAGRAELLRRIVGLEPLRGGKIRRGRRPLRWRTPRRLLRAGVGMAAGGGICPDLSIADNLTLPCLRRFSLLGVVQRERQSFAALDWMEKLRIRARTPRQPAGELSGGNRQKLLLGRLLLHRSAVLLLEEPTRGIDARTRVQIYEMLDALAGQGRGILLVSSDPGELLALCDTIALLRQGRLVETRPARAWTEPEMIAAALGPP